MDTLEYDDPPPTIDLLDKLPEMRYEGADVIIKLSASPDGWLLLHSDVLCNASPVLAATLLHDWARPKRAKNPKTGEEMLVYTICLARADDGLMLEIKEDVHFTEEDMEALAEALPFSQSTWPDARWPKCNWHEYFHNRTLVRCIQEDLHAMFAILYDLPVSIGAITSETYHGDDLHTLNARLDRLINICAYAKFYDCLHIVAPAIIKLLHNEPLTWKAVCRWPDRFLCFAERLNDARIYFDALRHIIGSSKNYAQMGELLGTSEETAWLHYSRTREDLKDLVSRVEHDLICLQLSSSPWTFSLQKYTAKTTFLNAIGNWGARSPIEGVTGRSDHMARIIYSQWLAQQLSGEYVYKHSSGKVRASGELAFNLACHKLIEAASSDTPSKLFGYTAPGRYVSMFSFGRSDEQQIRSVLDHLATVAARIITEAFEPFEKQDGISTITYRSAQYDRGRGYFTYVGLNENDTPWNDKPVRKHKAMLKLNTEPASEAWLDAVGLGEDALFHAEAATKRLSVPISWIENEAVTLLGDEVQMPQDFDEEEA